MDKTDYKYRIDKICFKNNSSFEPKRINVFIGANNCGKTQLLKDILAYITGKNDNRVFVEELEVPYPQSWDEMQQAYDMKIATRDHGVQFQHISPTFDENPVGFVYREYTELVDVITHYLEENKQEFRAITGAGLVSYLNTDNRLNLSKSYSVEANLNSRGAKNVLEALYQSDSNSVQKVKECIKKILNIDVFLNPYNLGSLEFKVGEDFSSVPTDPQEANKYLARFESLDSQGDGLRSVLGIIGAMVSTQKPIILLDEPEAFLHPPQALRLGEIISELVDENQQIFIATHSADFLRGLLSASQNSVIVHLDRSYCNTQTNVLDPDTLHKIVTNPLLSSSRVLEGMFYKGVVATEADADTVFYQRLFQKIGGADQIHFVHAHNKQTLKKVVEPYRKLGIRFAMIADADVIRDQSEFGAILKTIVDKRLKNTIMDDREKIMKHFQSKNKRDILQELKEKTQKLIDECVISESSTEEECENKLENFRRKLKKLREGSDDLSEFKEKGRASLPLELQETFDSLWNMCANAGLFIVKVGELESWLEEYGVERKDNKATWISAALDEIPKISYDAGKEIWKFMDELKNFLIDSDKGLK